MGDTDCGMGDEQRGNRYGWDVRGPCGDREPGASRTGPSRRHLLATAATTSLGTTVAGCLGVADVVGSSDDEEALRVGVLGGTTHDAITTAVEVAAARFNENGGIDGREVTVLDRETNSSRSRSRARRGSSSTTTRTPSIPTTRSPIRTTGPAPGRSTSSGRPTRTVRALRK